VALQVRPVNVWDFPTGCVVVPADDKQVARLNVQPGTKGIVVTYDVCNMFLVVWWEGRTRPGTTDVWVPSSFRMIARTMPIGTMEAPDGKLVIGAVNAGTISPPVGASLPNLKQMNTDGRTECAACGVKLKDPGMGPPYRYCPACEP